METASLASRSRCSECRVLQLICSGLVAGFSIVYATIGLAETQSATGTIGDYPDVKKVATYNDRVVVVYEGPNLNLISGGSAPPFQLIINDTVMTSLDAPTVSEVPSSKAKPPNHPEDSEAKLASSSGAAAKKLKLTFKLKRNPLDADSAKQWSEVLARRNGGGCIPMRLELAVKAKDIVPISIDFADGNPQFDPRSKSGSAILLEPLPIEGQFVEMGKGLKVKILYVGSAPIALSGGVAKNAHLQIDGVVMRSLPDPVTEVLSDGSGVELTYMVQRDPNNETSRGEWIQILRHQHSYELTLALALAINDSGAISMEDALQMRITTIERGYIWAIGGLILFACLFVGLARTSALRDRPGGPYSLARSQMAFWGLLIFISFVCVFANTGMMEYLPPTIWGLIGISGLTGISAIAVDTAKSNSTADLAKQLAELQTLMTAPTAAVEAQKEQLITELAVLGSSKDPVLVRSDRRAVLEKSTKVLLDNSSRNPIEDAQMFGQQKEMARIDGLSAPQSGWRKCLSFLIDICSDENGIAIHRLQVVLWTVALGIIFIKTILDEIAMPQFSTDLLALMGISGGVYVGIKSQEKPAASVK